MNTAKKQLGGAGTSTAAIAFGGENPGSAVLAINELWNGTSWTETADLNTARNFPTGVGTSTAALSFGGNSPADPREEITEQCN
jgi:uracil-DNA glycosylase